MALETMDGKKRQKFQSRGDEILMEEKEEEESV